MYLAGPNTYYPLNAFSKKQTSITMSSTESEVVSANHGVRAQGLPSLSLWIFLWRQVEIDPANHKVRPKTPCPVKIDGVIARVDPELDGDSEKMRHTDRPDIEGAAEQLLSAKVNQQIAVEGASHNTKAAYPLRTKADLVLWNHDHDLESNLLTSEACPCAAGRKTTPDIMTTTQTGVDRPTAPLTVYHQGDTARLEWLHSLLWCDIFGDELSQTTSEDFTTTLSAVYADKPPQVAAQVTFAGSANADQFPTIKKLAEVSDEGLSRIQPGDSRGREKGLVIVSDSTTVFMAGKRTFCDLAPDIKEMRTGNGILSHYAHVEYCPIWGASLPPIVDKVHELVGKIIQESSRPQSLAVDVMIIWMGNELFGRRGVFVASLSSPSEENVKFLQEAYPFDRYGERVYRMKHVFDRALFNAQYSRRLLRQAEIQQATEDCPDPWETEWAASSSAGPSTTATFDEVMAAIPYRTPDNQTIAGLRRLRAEGEAIQAKAKAAREAAAPHSGGRMLPPAEDLIGYTWDEDAILNDMLGVDDAMFGSHDAEGMVILTKADIPTAHLDKLVPSPCQFLHSDQDIDQTRLNGLVRSPGQFVRCWSSRPVSASVQNRPRLVRSLGQLVRSDRGNRPGPVDRVRPGRHPVQFVRSDRPGRPFRSGRSGHPVDRVRSVGQFSGPIGPVARSGRVGPFARQFVRSPVPVSFSFRPDLVTGLNGEPGCPKTQEAFPESGYARLATAGVFRCLHASRCPGAPDCATGYFGPLCVDCAPGFRSTGTACAECLDLHGESIRFVSCALLGVLCLAAAAGMAYAYRGRFPSPGLTSQCAGRLFVTQAPVLLQLAQLWSVMGHLGALRDHEKEAVMEAEDASAATTGAVDSDPLLSYVEVLQLTGRELISFVDLQCRADGTSVRAFLSLATPLFPLVVLAVCTCLELGSRGTGVNAALKALTLLFVGGAAGAVQLLSCQEYDGEGRQIPEEFAFRPLFPSLRCADHGGLAAWVDAVGWSSGVVYAIVVPVFLDVLFAKQSVCTQQTKTVLLVSDDKTADHVQLEVKRAYKSDHIEEEVLVKRNVAAAAAFIAAGFRGRATVQLTEDKVIVIPLQRSSLVDSEITAENLFVQSNTSQADAVRRNVMMQMLIERSILEEITSDRMMIGAKQLLNKYASGSYVWMEAVQWARAL
ncbi:hypothetical protein AK812_SmicGene36364 [Symbiodinium microadriaticum]|uniref:Uncharacterized protein n=1 Tax=Symbiodinium microadriaticum TaxID=2951 RepID=A0A1Q9CJ25_SYMMI|nr:hypothetical protein AK812_SmicGene36364 [Symbiodinium microadriaticum]